MEENGRELNLGVLEENQVKATIQEAVDCYRPIQIHQVPAMHKFLVN